MRKLASFDEIPLGENLVVLGLSNGGKATARRLAELGASVRFIVDDNPTVSTYCNIPVCIPENVKIASSDVCLLCIAEIYDLSYEKILAHDFIKRIAASSEQILILGKALSLEPIVLNCLHNHGVDTTGDVLRLNDKMVIPNFLKAPKGVHDVFIMDACNLILPPVYGDCSMIGEGPYDYQAVSTIPPPGIFEDRVIIDCGANLGLFSAYATQYEQNMVYAFEPTPSTVDVLNETASLYDNIEVLQAALSDQTGTVRLHTGECFIGNSIVHDTYSTSSEIVPCTTIDDFVRERGLARVDFIKADIEGAERLMLRGAAATLREFAPQLAICTYHLLDDPQVLERIIKDANPRYIVKHAYKKLYAYVE